MNSPAFLPDPETGISPVAGMDGIAAYVKEALKDTPKWKSGVWMSGSPSSGQSWPVDGTSPRTLRSRLSLLEARERLTAGVTAPRVRRRFPWWLWALVAVPVVVALAWRLL